MSSLYKYSLDTLSYRLSKAIILFFSLIEKQIPRDCLILSQNFQVIIPLIAKRETCPGHLPNLRCHPNLQDNCWVIFFVPLQKLTVGIYCWAFVEIYLWLFVGIHRLAFVGKRFVGQWYIKADISYH